MFAFALWDHEHVSGGSWRGSAWDQALYYAWGVNRTGSFLFASESRRSSPRDRSARNDQAVLPKFSRDALRGGEGTCLPRDRKIQPALP